MLRVITARQTVILEHAVPGMESTANIVANTAVSQICVLRHITTQNAEDRKGFEDKIAFMADQNTKSWADYEKTLATDAERGARQNSSVKPPG